MTTPRLYDELAEWWPVMSAPEDYAEEAALFAETLETAAAGPVRTLLELGSGGGHTASHLKKRFDLTLVEPSVGMRAASERRNPEARHVDGDMRAVRLARTFDAVLVHDAVMYMTTEADLAAAMATAFAHCRPGGAALFVPDDTTETFRPDTSTGGHDEGDRSFRYLEWTHPPAPPGTTTFRTVYAFLMKSGGGPVRCERDEHVLGLFPRATWLRLLHDAGFDARARPFEHSTFEADAGRELFIGIRPA